MKRNILARLHNGETVLGDGGYLMGLRLRGFVFPSSAAFGRASQRNRVDDLAPLWGQTPQQFGRGARN